VRNPQCGESQTRPTIHRRSRNDAVVIRWKSLRLHEALPPTRRAAIPISKLLPAAVKSRDDRLRFDGHRMLRAVSEIDQLLRMAQSETAARAGMAGVGGGSCISTPQRLRHCAVADRSRPTAVADGFKLAV